VHFVDPIAMEAFGNKPRRHIFLVTRLGVSVQLLSNLHKLWMQRSKMLHEIRV
jgi:hypothetical protein